MPNITISVPDWLYEKMKRLPHINWSAVCRRCIIMEVELQEALESVRKEMIEKMRKKRLETE